MRTHLSQSVVIFGLAVAACGGGQPSSGNNGFIHVERRPDPVWPRAEECPGEAVPSSAFVGDRGIEPLESSEQLAGLVGKTLYITTAHRYWGGAPPKKTVLPGESVVLCRVGSFDERGLERTDEDGHLLHMTDAQKAASDTWVLVKAHGDVMMNLPIWTLSVRPPRLNLDEPGTAHELLVGALHEGHHAMQELRSLKSVGAGSNDRGSPAFWKQQARRSYEDAVRSSDEVASLLVKPTGRRGGAADATKRARSAATLPGWAEKASDKTIREWAVDGIDDKALFDAYRTFPECISLDRDPESPACSKALGYADRPPTASSTSHFGGTLVVKRIPKQARVELDGKPVTVSGSEIKASYDSDGSHPIVVTPTNSKCRPFSTMSVVNGGAIADVTVVILPSPGCRHQGEP